MPDRPNDPSPSQPPPAPFGPDADAPARGPAPDPMKVLMPSGEVGSRNPPGTRFATESGGTSGSEDTSRAAGYVTDLSAPRDTPPGPPVKLDPAQLAGPNTVPAPPQKLPPRAPAVPPAAGDPPLKSLEREYRSDAPTGPVDPWPSEMRPTTTDVPTGYCPKTVASGVALVCLLLAFIAAYFGFGEIVPSIAPAARIASLLFAALFVLLGFWPSRTEQPRPKPHA